MDVYVALINDNEEAIKKCDPKEDWQWLPDYTELNKVIDNSDE